MIENKGLENIKKLWRTLASLLKQLIGDVNLDKGNLQEQIDELDQKIKEAKELKATLEAYGLVKLSNSSAVTDSTGLALPATEKNASIGGTLANQISVLNTDLTDKFYGIENKPGVNGSTGNSLILNGGFLQVGSTGGENVVIDYVGNFARYSNQVLVNSINFLQCQHIRQVVEVPVSCDSFIAAEGFANISADISGYGFLKTPIAFTKYSGWYSVHSIRVNCETLSVTVINPYSVSKQDGVTVILIELL